MSRPSFAFTADAVAHAPKRQQSLWRRMWERTIAVHQAEADRHVEELLGKRAADLSRETEPGRRA